MKPTEPAAREAADYLRHAKRVCKVVVRKDWKAGLEGGSWFAMPFDWTTLPQNERELLQSPPAGLTPFALVGSTLYDGSFAKGAADPSTWVFAFNAQRQVVVLHGEIQRLTTVLVDDVVFKVVPIKKTVALLDERPA